MSKPVYPLLPTRPQDPNEAKRRKAQTASRVRLYRQTLICLLIFPYLSHEAQELSVFCGLSFCLPRLKTDFKAHPGSTPTRRKAPLRIDRFADELPYAQFEESDKLCVIAAPDGSFEGLGFVIEVTPQTGTSLNMAKSLEHMIGSILPDGTGVQVSLFGSPFIEPLVELVRSQTLRPTPEDTPARAEQKDLLSAMTQAKAKFLSRSATQAPHPALPILGRNLRCWISVVIPTKDPFTSEARDNALLVRKVMVSTLNQWHFTLLSGMSGFWFIPYRSFLILSFL